MARFYYIDGRVREHAINAPHKGVWKLYDYESLPLEDLWEPHACDAPSTVNILIFKFKVFKRAPGFIGPIRDTAFYELGHPVFDGGPQ